MLVLFNSQNDRIHTFKTYDALYSHLENREKVKQKPKRVFARYSWQHDVPSRNRGIRPMDAFDRGLEQALRQAAGTPGEGVGASRHSEHPAGQEGGRIRLINRDGTLVGHFEGEGDLFSYIVGQAASAADGKDREDWRFTYSSWSQLQKLVKEMGNKSLLFMAHKACQQGHALVTVAAGDADNLSFFIATPDLNIAALRRDWCKRFCAAHGLRIMMG